MNRSMGSGKLIARAPGGCVGIELKTPACRNVSNRSAEAFGRGLFWAEVEELRHSNDRPDGDAVQPRYTDRGITCRGGYVAVHSSPDLCS